MSVDLICIDPKEAHKFWPHVKELLHKAIRRTNLNHFQDIEFDILCGDGLLWIVWNGKAIECAATTSLVETEAGKACVLTACGGEDMKRWLPLMSKIETYAKDEGCTCVRIYGRKGWQRVLDGYEMKHVILEKGLT